MKNYIYIFTKDGKTKLPNTTYINRKYNNALTEEDIKYNQLVEEYSDLVKRTKPSREHKLKQLAKYFNTTTDAVLNKLIDTAYNYLPKTTYSTLDKLVVPDNILSYRQLTEYLEANYTNQSEIVFKQDNYDYIIRTSNFKGKFSWKEYFTKLCPKAKIVFVD